MKGPGLFSMLQIAAGMSMAAPMVVIGFEFVRSGQHAAGVAFFALGIIALYAPTYVLRQIGGPRAWIKRRIGRGEDPETGEDERRPFL